ncbi:TerB family tellurite resistance protein [Amaricoccus sp.]|uniref:tellurite resistance TerB family protein n=1 Tax=Amaricoccus sp. TaxID=1872485 RepID=UPI001B681C6D|nr:TerB family tellurite resistance protein [Amaricoccus sp.]MBP7002627.1 TerB family tellurite resistance protein [Amaricoccus sp.]
MLADLIRRLAAPPDPAPLAPEDCRLALAALMVRLARADDSYTGRERQRIDRILAERYRLDAASATALRAEAEAAEEAAPDTVRFTRHIKAAVPYEDRVGVIEALWQVATADEVDADERAFLRLVANLIGVTDQDSGLARQRAAEAAPRRSGPWG